jgi:hypothetical protein
VHHPVILAIGTIILAVTTTQTCRADAFIARFSQILLPQVQLPSGAMGRTALASTIRELVHIMVVS